MTNEEALDYFERDVEFCKENAISGEYEKDIEADLIAIDAITLQISQFPTQDAKTRYHCPICKNWIAEYQHYCDKCGQAINWAAVMMKV